MRVSTLLLSASATSARSCGERESGARADQSVRCQDGADTRVAAGGTYDHISSGRHVASDRPHFEPRWHAYDRCHALGLSRAFRLVPVVEPLLHLAPARARANAALYARGGGRGRRERHAGVSLQEHLCRPECARSEVPSERIDGSQRGRDCAAMARLWHWPCIDWSSVVVWLACDGERLDREAVSDQGEAGGEGGRRQELEALHVHVDLFRVCHLQPCGKQRASESMLVSMACVREGQHPRQRWQEPSWIPQWRQKAGPAARPVPTPGREHRQTPPKTSPVHVQWPS